MSESFPSRASAVIIGGGVTNESHARLAEYSMRLLKELEEETGQSTGFRQVGSLSIAHSEDRWEELRRVGSMNNAFGVTRVDQVSPEEIGNLFPLIDTSGLIGVSSLTKGVSTQTLLLIVVVCGPENWVVKVA